MTISCRIPHLTLIQERLRPAAYFDVATLAIMPSNRNSQDLLKKAAPLPC
jgi:hypothetical protein